MSAFSIKDPGATTRCRSRRLVAPGRAWRRINSRLCFV